jgi:hypothetical protein
MRVKKTLAGFAARRRSMPEMLSQRHAQKEKALLSQGFDLGGADGARTRDPRRDRPVF